MTSPTLMATTPRLKVCTAVSYDVRLTYGKIPPNVRCMGDAKGFWLALADDQAGLSDKSGQKKNHDKDQQKITRSDDLQNRSRYLQLRRLIFFSSNTRRTNSQYKKHDSRKSPIARWRLTMPGRTAAFWLKKTAKCSAVKQTAKTSGLKNSR